MRWSIRVLVAAAAVAIAIPFALDGAWPWAVAAVVLGIFWMIVPAHSYDWTASLGLIGFTLLAGAVILRYSMTFWALAGVLAALAAWDLSSLMQRLALTEDIRDGASFLRAHLLQLSAVLIGAWILALLAMQVTIPVGFLWSLALILLLALSLGFVVRAARQTETAKD